MGSFNRFQCRAFAAVFVMALCIFATYVDASRVKKPTEPICSVVPHNYTKAAQHSHHGKHTTEGRKLVLVEPDPIVLTYHGGALLTTGPVIPVYVIWYGSFSVAQRSTLLDFIGSFGAGATGKAPSVKSWWKLTSGYKTQAGASVAQSMKVAGQMFLTEKKGKALMTADLQGLLVRSLKKFPAKSNAIYVIFTAADVQMEGFCMNTCASHFASDKAATKGKTLPYIVVGNPATQCPGLCAWPYAKPAYGPPNFTPLVAPNGDVGIDGMIISFGDMLAGLATNPYDNGYFQGDASDPNEAATACLGIYGPNAYPGYPGDLLVDPVSKASYNVQGVKNRKFLLNALWNPVTSLCTTPY